MPDSPVVWLSEVHANDAPRVGAKAANLGELKRSGLPVPDGFVVFGEPGPELAIAADRLGPGPFAVRSSGSAEDLAEASFAGQYETILDVDPKDVPDAIRRCRESALATRVASYADRRGVVVGNAIAVLIQRMVRADAAGVAFTANPVTGDRSEVVLSAVKGLGERLVSGQATAEQWIIRDGFATRKAGDAIVLTRNQAEAAAEMARHAADHFGRPQDVEWALADGEMFVLQSRPMTAVPDQVDWTPPGPGYWMRNLRLGEWLPEPVTPLFEDWLLKRLNAGFARGNRIDVGLGAGLRQATVNGWYYATPQPDLRPGPVLRMAVLQPARLLRFATALLKQSTDPELSERRFFARVVGRWREEALPAYRRLVEERATEVDSATKTRLVDIVDELGESAGEQFWCLAVGGGSAWKLEVALARFYREHLEDRVDVDVMTLLIGLPSRSDHSASHLVDSLDWFRPTLGERANGPAPGLASDRRQALAHTRQAAEAACRSALSGAPELLARFDRLLELAQRYVVLREEQAFIVTLAWPVLRRCVLRLASDLGDDAFFLLRSELDRLPDSSMKGIATLRREEWERRRRLVAPLSLGRAPRLLARMLGSLELLRSESVGHEGALRGEPASPGRASGPVRVVRGPADFDAFREGEVLVAQATAPAWTPLFVRAAAVVTDGGSLAAHASLVAREYGIPAVVAVGDATSQLATGQWVTVDGSGGFVEVQE